MRRPGGGWKLVASVGGIGYAPIAPGTWGTVPAVVVWYLLAPFVSAWTWAAVAVLTTLIAAYAAHQAGKLFGVVDAGAIVIDEVAGTFWTFLLIPHGWGWAVAGFFAFRLFDIVKPWPASYFDKHVKNGFGVTMDDVVAGWYACAVLHAAAWLIG